MSNTRHRYWQVLSDAPVIQTDWFILHVCDHSAIWLEQSTGIIYRKINEEWAELQ